MISKTEIRKYRKILLWCIFLLLPFSMYSQWHPGSFQRAIERGGKEIRDKAQQRQSNPPPYRSSGGNDTRPSTTTNSREASPPPPQKHTYKGVDYSTKAAMDAAIKKEKEETEKKHFQQNIKPKVDAGFRSINSTSNASSGLRDVGVNRNQHTKRPRITERQAVAVSENVMHNAKNTHDIITDARVWKTADDIVNLSGKNVLLLPIDKSAQKMKQVVTDAIQQKAGYTRGSAENKAVTLAVSNLTNFTSNSVKQDINRRYFPDSKSSQLFVNKSLKQELNDWKENIANYLGIRGKAIDNVAWYGKNTPITINESLKDILAAVKEEISTAEYNRRRESRWSNYGQSAVKQALK